MHRPYIFVFIAISLVGILLLAIGLALFFFPESSEPDRTVSRPNVVLILMDAFRADKIGGQRNDIPLTPFLDSLRSRAAYFPNAIANCTWTRPSMASLFTAMYVESHQVIFDSPNDGITEAYDALSVDIPIISTVFKEAGYKTIGIQTNGNLFPELGFSRDFEVYRTSLDAPGSLVTDWSIEELRKTSTPFFLYAHYMDPHLPYQPAREYKDMMGYRPESLSAEERSIVDDFGEYLVNYCAFKTGQNAEFPFPALSEPAKEAVRTLYDGLIRYTDDQVGRLLTMVQENFPNTIVIVLADHGEHFWDHDRLGHGTTLFNCELRIPLILSGDKIPARVFNHTVQLVDILPTLSKLLGLHAFDFWQGSDLFQVSDVPVFSRTRSISPAHNTNLEAVIADGYKLIVDYTSGNRMLFDWTVDPAEQHDLSKSHPEKEQSLYNLLQRQQQLNLRTRRGSREQTTLDDETRENLKRIGYIH